MPLLNWWKIHEENNLIYVFKDYDYSKKTIAGRYVEFISAQWKKLYNEYLDRYGIDEDFKKWFEMKRDIDVMKLEMFAYDNPSLGTFIKIKELEFKEQYGKATQSNFNDTLAYVEKFMGLHIYPENTSVSKYYSYVKMMKEQSKRTASLVKQN